MLPSPASFPLFFVARPWHVRLHTLNSFMASLWCTVLNHVTRLPRCLSHQCLGYSIINSSSCINSFRYIHVIWSPPTLYLFVFLLPCYHITCTFIRLFNALPILHDFYCSPACIWIKNPFSPRGHKARSLKCSSKSLWRASTALWCCCQSRCPSSNIVLLETG